MCDAYRYFKVRSNVRLSFAFKESTAQYQCDRSAVESTTYSHAQWHGWWLAATNDLAYVAKSGLRGKGLLRQNGNTIARADHSASAAAESLVESRPCQPGASTERVDRDERAATGP